MKEYIKPELDLVSFATESIADVTDVVEGSNDGDL